MNKFAVLLLLLIHLATTFAQQNDRANYLGFQAQHALYQWTTSNGLPQSHVSGIVQTSDQLIWISTYNGLVRFDGQRFQQVELSGSRRSLSERITALAIRNDTIIWSTPQEIVYFHHTSVAAVYPLKEEGVFIASVQRMDDNDLFLAHDRVYLRRKGELKQILLLKNIPEIAGGTILTGIPFGKELVLLVRNPDGTTFLCRVHPESGKCIPKKTIVRAGNLKKKGTQLMLFSVNSWYALNQHLETTNIVHRFDGAPGTPILQAGFEEDRFFYYSREEMRICPVGGSTTVLSTAQSMYGNELFVSFVDGMGNLWLGTNSMGLFLIVRYPFTFYNFLDNEPVNNSSHAFYDSKGILWFDSDCQQTLGIDTKSQRVAYRIPDICDWSCAEWSADSLVFLSYGNTHHWFNRTTRKVTPLREINFPVTNYLRLAPRSFILAGEGALYKWNGKTPLLWKRFKSAKTTCNELLQINNDEFYFATTEGLYHYRQGKWKYSNITRRSSGDLRSLLYLKEKKLLLIGTEGNYLYRYHTITAKTDTLPHPPEQLRNVWCMLRDNSGYLWISTNNGLVRLSLQELLKHFDRTTDRLMLDHYRYEHGINNVEFNSRTANKGARLPDGRLLFSGLGGPVIITPEEFPKNNPSQMQLLLGKITVNDQKIFPDSVIRITEGDFLNVQFTLPCYASEHVLEFEYRIRGHRNFWTSTVGHTIALDNLPPGDYMLEIRATCGARILRVPVKVQQRNPNRWMAALIITVLSGLCIVFVTMHFTKRSQEKKHALRDLQQQLKLLEMEALRSQMNPHFIFNCLNTIQFLFISGNVSRANKYLTNFSALMRMTLDLLREPITTLDLELKATELYIELEQLQFDEDFEYRLINELVTPINQIRVPSLFFQVFVENAVLHGLRKTTEKHPILTLTFEETADRFIFRIGDNGPGLNNEKKEDHTSIGMKLLQDRFTLKSEIFNWHMSYSIRENETIENDIKTEIIITFGKVLVETTENEYPHRR